MASGYVLIHRDAGGGWRFTPVAANGEKEAASESYVRKWNARRAAKNLFPERELREEGRDGAS